MDELREGKMSSRASVPPGVKPMLMGILGDDFVDEAEDVEEVDDDDEAILE